MVSSHIIHYYDVAKTDLFQKIQILQLNLIHIIYCVC
jgi:hypothetical protein